MSQSQGTGGQHTFHIDDSRSFDGILNGVMHDVRIVAKDRARGMTAQTTIGHLGLDSLERLDVVARVESRFRVRIPETVVDQIETSHDLASAVDQLIAQQASVSENGRVPLENYVFEKSPEFLLLQREFSRVKAAGEHDLFFREHASISNHLTTIDGQSLINFSGNNYLGMSGDTAVTAASIAAIQEFGTSVSASRIVSGTRPIHTELEQAICEFLSARNCITFTAGHTTNALVIGHLFGPEDLILHDELVHNSILVGCKISGAHRRAFPHNDWKAASDYLQEMRGQYRKAVIVIEGLYSMDGDYPDLPRFIEVKERHQSWLYIDEAHSIGTLGRTGRGLAEVYDLPRDAAEIWMGTLSKAIGSCGGFITARDSIVQFLKYTCPGVVFTVGLSPASCGAALAALQMLGVDNSRVGKLQANAEYFLQRLKSLGFNTGESHDSPIVPVILGDSLIALRASRELHERGISVQPIMYPAVANEKSRLRFFMNAMHTGSQLDEAIAALQEVVAT